MQPQQSPYPPSPTPSLAPPPVGPAPPPTAPMGYPSSPPPPTSSGKKWLLIGGLVALLLIVAAGAYFLFLRKSGSSPQSGTSQTLNLPAGSAITAQTLANYNKDDLFWGYFQNAARQTKVVATHSQVALLKTGDKVGEASRIKTGYDYQTKKLQAAKDDLDNSTNTKVNFKERCYDGKQYERSVGSSSALDSWQTGNTDFCDIGSVAWWLSDGVNTGGLTASQAQAFVSELRNQKGLVTVNSVQLADHKGKTYLHFSADLKPVLLDGSYEGVPWLQMAFDKTGLDATTHPYYPKQNFGGGYHMEYWIDPNAQLPAYVEVSDTPAYDDSGKPKPLDGGITLTTIFNFGTATFDVQTSNEADINATW